MSTYRPNPPPATLNLEGVVQWLVNELNLVSQADEQVEVAQLTPLSVEPSKPQTGWVVFADGTHWDPGSGAGVYVYDGGWIPLA